MRRILHLLRDDDAELAEALHHSGHNLPDLEELVDVFRAAGLPVHLIRVGKAIPNDPTLATTVYRIVQEGLTNALRYAEGATRVEVRLESDGVQVALTITDDGHAPAAGAPSQGSGRGLRGVAERAAAYSGTSASGRLPHRPDGRTTRRPCTSTTKAEPIPHDSATDLASWSSTTSPSCDLAHGQRARARQCRRHRGHRRSRQRRGGRRALAAELPPRRRAHGRAHARHRRPSKPRELITTEDSRIKVIVFTTFDIDEYAFGGLHAGASAFLLKSAAPETLTAAVRTVAAGDSVVEPRITTQLIDHYVKRDATPVTGGPPSPLDRLTPREYDVFLAIATGLSNPEISARPAPHSGDGEDPRQPRLRQALPQRPRVHAVILAYKLEVL